MGKTTINGPKPYYMYNGRPHTFRELHEILYKWMGDNNGCKAEWPGWDTIKFGKTAFNQTVRANMCFACAQALYNQSIDDSPKNMCYHCPIPEWRKYCKRHYAPCTMSDSLYSQLVNAKAQGLRNLYKVLCDEMIAIWPEENNRQDRKPVATFSKRHWYKTRNDLIAYVYFDSFINSGGEYPLGGAVREEKGWLLAQWTKHGRFIGKTTDHDLDLMPGEATD